MELMEEYKPNFSTYSWFNVNTFQRNKFNNWKIPQYQKHQHVQRKLHQCCRSIHHSDIDDMPVYTILKKLGYYATG